MALVKGTSTMGAPGGGSKVYTLTNAVTVPSGTNRFLLFVMAHDPQGYSGGYTATGVTFNGTAMTKKTTQNFAGFYETSWGLVNADAGLHDIVVTFTGPSIGLYYGWRWLACGFTGSSGFGNTATASYANSPHSKSIECSTGSGMYCGGAGTFEASKITTGGQETVVGSCDLRGSVYTKNWVGNIDSSVSSGIQAGIVTGTLTSYQYTNTTLEIKAASTATVPTVTTDDASNEAACSFTAGGNVTSDGGDTILARGVIWSITDSTPTVDTGSTYKLISGTTGTFSDTIDNMQQNTTYYFRTFAANSIGTSYGTVKTVTTTTKEREMTVGDKTISTQTFTAASSKVYTVPQTYTKGCLSIIAVVYDKDNEKYINSITSNTASYTKIVSHPTEDFSSPYYVYEFWETSDVLPSTNVTITMNTTYTGKMGVYSATIKNCSGAVDWSQETGNPYPTAGATADLTSVGGIMYCGGVGSSNVDWVEIDHMDSYSWDGIYWRGDTAAKFANTFSGKFCGGAHDCKVVDEDGSSSSFAVALAYQASRRIFNVT